MLASTRTINNAPGCVEFHTARSVFVWLCSTAGAEHVRPASSRKPSASGLMTGIDPYAVGADSISARAPCPCRIRPAGERKVRPGRAILPNKEHRRSGSRVGGAFLNKSLITVRFHAGRHAFPSGWQGSFPPSASGPRSARAAASRAAALQ